MFTQTRLCYKFPKVLSPSTKYRKSAVLGTLEVKKIWWFIAAAVLLLFSAHANAAEKVTLQLRWHHQFQFAGYYAAKAKGFYRDAGLDVFIVAGAPGREPIDQVLTGRSQYGAANSELLFERLHGKPLVALAAIFQHAAGVLLVRRDSGILSPQDLVGRRVMSVGVGKEADIGLMAMLKNEGVDPGQVKFQKSSYDINDLVKGNTDAFNSYLTNEPYFLKAIGVPFTVINPATYGIDFYSDILFTSEDEVRNHPDRVKRFRKASLRGWTFAMQNQEEIIGLILSNYESTKTRDHLRFEANAMADLILPNLIEIGHMNPGRWKHMADTFVKEGLADPGYSLEGFIYDPDPPPDLRKWYRLVAGLIVALLVVVMIVVVVVYFNRKLKRGIGERMGVEKALQESEERLRHIVDTSPFGISIVSRANRKRLYANRHFIEMLGGGSDEKILKWQAAESYADPSKREQNWAAFERDGILTSTEEQRKRLDGTTWWCLADWRPIVFEGKEAVINWHYDITERKRAEEALRESQARLENILDNSPAPIYFKDTKGRFLVANRRYQEMYEVKFEDIKGKTSKEIFGNELGEMSFSHDQEVLKTRKEVEREENIFEKTYLTLKFPIIDRNGVLLGLGGIETDITEIKQAEKEMLIAKENAELANRSKSEFLAHMSHELRTPLNSVIGFSEMLEKEIFGSLGDAKYQEYAKDIHASGTHLLNLISDILDISKIEAGELDFTEVSVDVGEIIVSSTRMVTDRVERGGITLGLKVPQSLPRLRGDELRLKQILLNLLSNAIKFTPQGGQVTIEAKVDGSNAMVWKVVDTGVGIAATNLSRVLDPFEQVRDNAALAHEGTGLGLYLTNALTELHDGTLEIESEVGKGTTVTVRFPPERTI